MQKNKTKQKILFILQLPPPVHGSSVVGQYVKESSVINEAFDCHYLNLCISSKMNEIGKSNISKLLRYLAILGKGIWQLTTFRPQLCYVAITIKGFALYKDAILVLLVKLFGVKLVYHLHNKGVSNWQDKPFDNFVYKNVFKNAEIILLSKYLYPDIQKYVSMNRVHFCPNGIPLASSKTKKTNNSHKNQPVRILFLSNLIESKGVYVLLEACKILQNKNIPFSCTFIGGEGDVSKENFQSKTKELNLFNVHYAGKKYGIEKEQAFTNTDIFVFPTFYDFETFGLVNLEAMQFRLPVVSTFEGGIPDVIENRVTGFLVPQRDAQDLAKKLEILIKNPQLRIQMGEAGYLRYKNQFTLSIFENRLKDILTELLKKNSPFAQAIRKTASPTANPQY